MINAKSVDNLKIGEIDNAPDHEATRADQGNASIRESGRLQALLGDVPVLSFIKEQYLRLPFARSGGFPDLMAVGGLPMIRQLLDHHDLDIIAGRSGVLRAQVSSMTMEQARQFIDEGETVGFRHVHDQHPLLANLATELSREIGGKTDIHLYWTPAGHPGFGWHYDAEEVFILQLAGCKRWSLRKNTVNPWPLLETLPADQRYEREIMPVLRSRLAPGDWLYIPSGYWHRGNAEEESISLSIGIRPFCAIDVFDSVRPILLESIEWRERLPPTGTAGASIEELRSTYSEILERLSRSLANTIRGDAFLRGLFPHDADQP